MADLISKSRLFFRNEYMEAHSNAVSAGLSAVLPRLGSFVSAEDFGNIMPFWTLSPLWRKYQCSPDLGYLSDSQIVLGLLIYIFNILILILHLQYSPFLKKIFFLYKVSGVFWGPRGCPKGLGLMSILSDPLNMDLNIQGTRPARNQCCIHNV